MFFILSFNFCHADGLFRADTVLARHYISLKPVIVANSRTGDISIVIRNNTQKAAAFCKWGYGFVTLAKSAAGKIIGSDNSSNGFLPNVQPYDWVELKPGEAFQLSTYLVDPSYNKIRRFKHGWHLSFRMTKGAQSMSPPDAIGIPKNVPIIELQPASLRL